MENKNKFCFENISLNISNFQSKIYVLLVDGNFLKYYGIFKWMNFGTEKIYFKTYKFWIL